MKCAKCKAPLPKGAKVCPGCGAKVTHRGRTALILALVLVLLLGAAGATAWQLGVFSPDEDRESGGESAGEKDTAPKTDAFPQWQSAAEATAASGSWTEELTMTVKLDFASGREKETVVIDSAMAVSGYGTDGLRISGEASSDAGGEPVSWTMDWAEGRCRYSYSSLAEERPGEQELEPYCFDFAAITRDLVSDTSVLGSGLRLTLRGGELSVPALALLDGAEQPKYEDARLTATLDRDTGTVSALTLSFRAELRYQGEEAEGDFRLEYRFQPHDASLDGLVTDAYALDCPYMGWVYDPQSGQGTEAPVTASYRIPQINLDSADAERINRELYDVWYGDIQSSADQISEYGMPYTSGGTAYRWMVNGDILSLVYTNDSYPDSSGSTVYRVYNLSVSTGAELSAEEVCAAAGLSPSEFADRAEEVLGLNYFQGKDFYVEQFGFESFFVQQFEKTVAAENVQAAQPYLNERGQLCIVARIYSLAAADFYWYDLNMEDPPAASESYESYMGEKASADAWKTAYADYVASEMERLEDDGYMLENTQYQLLYLNRDDIPELWICYPVSACGSVMCCFDGEQVNTVHISEYGIMSYIPDSGVFYTAGGKMDVYWEAVYEVWNGKFYLYGRGSYGAVDNTSLEYDENGDPIYQYIWRDELMSEEEYQRKLGQVFDFSAARSIFDNESDDYESLMAKLR